MNEGAILTNASFDFLFAGKIYSIKKANLRQVMEWQTKILELGKNTKTPDAAVVVPALLIILHATDPTVDENYILDNAPGDIDIMETLLTLGFISQQKVRTGLLRNSLANPPSGDKSSAQ